MVESEERPLKIRKLESTNKVDELHPKDHPFIAGVKEESREDSVFLPVSATDKEVQSPDKNDAVNSPTTGELQNQNIKKPKSEPKSRKQLKKDRKKQEWEAGREDRKAKRKKKLKEKRALKAQERVAASLNANKEAIPSEDTRRKNQAKSIQVPVTFILDCNFDDLMTESELISLGSQITRSYSDNKGSPYPAHMIISSFGGKLKQRFETVLAGNHLGWKGVEFTDEDFLAAVRDADATMRGSQGGRLVGALADAALPTTQPPTGVSNNVNVHIVTEPIESTDGVPSEVGENGLDVNLPQEPQEVVITTIGTRLDPLENSVIGEASSDSNGSPTQSSSITPKGNLTDTKPPFPSEDPGTIPVIVRAPAPTPSLIYLTSDSPNTLMHLSPYTSYIVGGLVDKNRHKGICYKRAMALGIPTARLPIDEYMTMQSRTVLTTNHVVEIMVRWLEEGDWGKAFLRVIPKRKEAKLRINGEDGKDGNERGNEKERKRKRREEEEKEKEKREKIENMDEAEMGIEEES